MPSAEGRDGVAIDGDLRAHGSAHDTADDGVAGHGSLRRNQTRNGPPGRRRRADRVRTCANRVVAGVRWNPLQFRIRPWSPRQFASAQRIVQLERLAPATTVVAALLAGQQDDLRYFEAAISSK